MSPDKLLMGGVVAAGAYAVYKMLTSKPLPPGAIEEDGVIMLGDPLYLEKGKTYRGRIELPVPQVQPIPPFNMLGTNQQLEEGMKALGFVEASIRSEAPSGWPETANPTMGSRWFEGIWGQATMSLPRPVQLVSIWLK